MISNSSKLRFKINFNPINYDLKTGKFEVQSKKYNKYDEARANHWKCDKCTEKFSTYKLLREHKKDIHAY